MSTSTSGGKLTTQWQCPECHKYLSSKRSYREHMNVHGKVRPFQCEKCNYAAASQMTLRRHRLRSHIPRRDWGYPCPYCSEIYMEPASYQQHVSHRHFGQSCTFGCPHKNCNFTSKCTKSFTDHISKHLVIVPESPETIDDDLKNELDPSKINPVKYLIDDEIGSGFGKPPRKAQIQRYPDVLSLTKEKGIRTKVTVAVNTKTMERKTRPSRIRPKEQIQTIADEELIQESSSIEPTIVTSNEDISTIEYKDDELESEGPQFFELVDENGVTLDGQLYYYEYDANGTPYLATASSDNWESFVEPEQPLERPVIRKETGERRLPDGQVDIDLD